MSFDGIGQLNAFAHVFARKCLYSLDRMTALEVE